MGMLLTRSSMNRRLFFIAFFCIVLLPHSAHAARLWSSGCELQGDTAGPANNATNNLEFSRPSGNPQAETIVADRVHAGRSSCFFTATTTAFVADNQLMFLNLSNAAAGPYFVRAYINIKQLPAERSPFIVLWDKGIDGLVFAVGLNTDGVLLSYNTSIAVMATGTTPLVPNKWYRIEAKYQSGAAYSVLIDGVTELSGTPTSGNVDSLSFGLCADEQGAVSTCNADAATTGEYYMDDIAINDSNSTSQTSFPGEGFIAHLQPDAAGDNSGCTAGTFASIAEITPDDGTTICTLTTDLGGDLLDVNVKSPGSAGIPSSATVSLIQVGVREAAATAAAETWSLRLKSAAAGTASGGTATTHDDVTYRTNGDTTVTGTPPGNYTLTSYLDPTTGVAWTPTGTNSLTNMQIGITDTDANPDINLSTLWALVEYIPRSARVYITNAKVFLKTGKLYIK